MTKRNSIGPRSPSNSIYENSNKSPSPSSQSQKSPLSRQGTVRASHRRKNSASHSLNLGSGRRSPLMPLDRSPSGRHSPNLLIHDINQHQQERKSPTRSPTGHKSPLIFSGLPIYPPEQRRTSPSKEMAIQSWNERFAELQKSPTASLHFLDRKSPVLTGPNTGAFFLEPRRSPINQLPIPPITISNASDTCGLSPKSIDSLRMPSPKEQSPVKEKDDTTTLQQQQQQHPVTPEKTEKKSVMREILAFVRKPSKKVSTRTSRFAAAFSKSNNDSNAPLVRQSTFSNMPNSSSRAGRTAVTKQMSYEPKISSKLKSVGSKMSLRLRRATADIKKDNKKSSGDEISDMESSERIMDEMSDMESSGVHIEYPESIYFEKVGQCHKNKHEQIVEEEDYVERINEGASTSRNGSVSLDKPRNLYEELKKSIETLFEHKEPIYENVDEFRRVKSDDDPEFTPKTTIQCPTFEIEPPSRRASFDPPRSPFLENFRSLSDTDHTDIPSGESFEVVDTHHRESSFEDNRHSSMDTSFDISRYQSTSYEDPTSSFEIVESHETPHSTTTTTTTTTTTICVKEDRLKASNIDLSKSSIEIVDPETFQKSSSQVGRKSSLETHFDLSENYTSQQTPVKSAFVSAIPGKLNECFPIGMKAVHQQHQLQQQQQQQFLPPHRTKSPILSNQTSSNYSSRDSYESSTSTYEPLPPHSHSHFVDLNKHHYPLPPLPSTSRKYSNDKTPFLSIDKRSSPRPSIASSSINNMTPQLLNTTDTSSGSEFEAPSPRRALSASPKHTFTFRIVMKKVESSPEDLCGGGANYTERANVRHQRERQSRRRKSRMHENKGKSF